MPRPRRSRSVRTLFRAAGLGAALALAPAAAVLPSAAAAERREPQYDDFIIEFWDAADGDHVFEGQTVAAADLGT